MRRKHPRNVNPKHAVAYLRVSTAEQHLGLDAQRDRIERFAASQGIEIVSWHTDHGVSGGTAVDDRPQLCEAFHQVDVRGCGVLLAAARDRIARDVVIAATVERLASTLGARVLTADGVLADDSPEAALMRTLIDAMAAYERAMIRSRVRAALRVKRERGEVWNGVQRIGSAAVDGRVVSNPDEQQAIEMIRVLSYAGDSQREICDKLTAAGLKPRGKRWHVTTVARIQRLNGLNQPARGPRGTKWGSNGHAQP